MDDFRPAGLTRRRALALGVAGGASGLLLRAGPLVGSGLAAGAAGRVRSAGLDLPVGAIPGGGAAGRVIRTPAPFDLVGLRGANLHGAGAELRVRPLGGRWSPWVPLGSGADHAPDVPRAAPASDPVWAGGAQELQLRARRAVPGGRLQLISVPAAAVRAGSGARVVATPRQASTGGATGVPAIIPRASWGAAAVPPRAAASYGVVSLAFVHHTVSANTYQPADSARIVLAIAKYHRDSNGWNDIGYNFLVDRFGQVFEGRAGGIEQAVIGAQAGGWNSQSTGIATIGDYGQIAFPEVGMAVLARLIAWKLTLHDVPRSGTVTLISAGGKENRYPSGQKVTLNRVSGHRDGCTTDCPGAILYGQLGDLRSRVGGLGPVTAAPARATLTAATARVAFGADVVLTGQVVNGDGTPAAGVPVSIQKKTKAGGWSRVTTARTSSTGSYEARVTWTREAPLRAVAQLTPEASGHVRSGELTVGLDPVLEIASPPGKSRVLAGQPVVVSGTVGPSGTVVISVARQETGGRWVDAGTVTATVRKGTFGASIPLRKAALYRLTVAAGSVAVAPVFVRAVRKASSLPGGQGGAGAPQTGTTGTAATAAPDPTGGATAIG